MDFWLVLFLWLLCFGSILGILFYWFLVDCNKCKKVIFLFYCGENLLRNKLIFCIVVYLGSLEIVEFVCVVDFKFKKIWFCYYSYMSDYCYVYLSMWVLKRKKK